MRQLAVVIVDDSPSVRAVVRRFLRGTPDIRVIGEAADGVEALELVDRLHPDVLLLDLVMPRLDGWGVLERLARKNPVPAVLLTSRADRAELRAAFEAMRSGAMELLPKPEDPESWRQLAEILPRALRAAAAAGTGVAHSPAPAPRAPVPDRPRAGRVIEWLAIGASTGGPAALRDLLVALPVPLSFPVVVVQHIARGFEGGLADWLAGSLGLDVRVALEGERPAPGAIRIAPGGVHLRVGADRRLDLDALAPPRRGHRPSVDELFLSLSRLDAERVAAVLLTGMGADGAEGLAELRRRGAVCLVQDEASSAVFGMPRAALELGAAEAALDPRALGERIGRLVGESR